ncbi:MAG: succinate dehydrogenase/fumarate reductase iron-sulfur subunit [Spirochaetia bacterium]|nr:succinate dehydrogenase/fumarate reductase iron-sulfur subunit [Spirochaetia bacterium]
MDEKKDIYFKIYRYNPEVDQKPFYDDFKISVERGVTILRAINYIKDHVDSSLSYRFYCQAGICGSCAMRVNGVSKLACTTQVWDELENCKEKDMITIEPLNNFEIIRDMIVDYKPVINKLEKYISWVTPKIKQADLGKKENIISEAEFKVIDAATDCILCAACFSECSMMSANKEYISPLALLKAFRMVKDSRDTRSDERMAVLNQDHGMWDCTHCYRCVEACVKNIPIMDAIQGVRNEAFIRKQNGTEGYKHANAFAQDIRKTGRLKEATIAIRTKGIFGAAGMLPFAIRMTLRGRMPSMFVKTIPGIKHVRNIFRKIK